MIKIGKTNRLKVSRMVDFGLYLSDEGGAEVLLPTRYVPEGAAPGQEIEVFVYRDNEGRPIATTDRPYAEVGCVAFLEVRQVNRIGAFLDWGLMKDLLVPFREQKASMRPGGVYPVYVYLDHATDRIVASAKIEKFIGNVLPDYEPGRKVRALVLNHVDGLGYRCVVDNLHWGMIYDSTLASAPDTGQSLDAFVRHVRPDGKIDLTLAGNSFGRTRDLGRAILALIDGASGGCLPLTDDSDPEVIRRVAGCSKREFKKAVGALYRKRLVRLDDDGIRRS